MTKSTAPVHTTPLTTAQLLAHTKLEAEARSLGVRGLPRAYDPELSAKCEAMVAEIVKHRIDPRHAELADAAHRIRSELAVLSDPVTSGAGEALSASVSQGLGQVFHTFDDKTRKVVADELEARAQLNAYREKHGLHDRAAHYPQSKIRALAIVLMVLLADAAGNTIMYLPAVSGGYLAAFITAVLVAGINVGVATGAGYLARFWNYHDLPPEQPNRKRNTHLWLVPTLVVAGLVVGFVNFFAAHFREVAMQSEGNFEEKKVLAHLLEHPFDLSLASYGLFVVGLLCAIFAAYKGYNLSDPYPGYETAHRRYMGKVEDREDLKAALHGHVDAVRHTHVDGPFNLTTATRAALDGIRRDHSALTIAAAQTAKLDGADLAAGAAALTRFRSVNRSVRTDGVVPKYFNEPIDLSHLVPGTAVEDLPESIEKVADAYARHTAQMLVLIAKQHKRIDRAKNSIDQLIPVIEGGGESGSELPSVAEVLRRIDTDDEGGNDANASDAA